MRHTWLLALATLCWLSSSAHAADAQRPNVLYIIADDLNNMLGCYGDSLAKTPNIDRLAARGVRFDRADCAFPLCGPSRNSILTGLYPNSTGILTNAQIFRQTIPAQVSMPQAFRQAGYFVARAGKQYHYNVPNSVGTDGHDDPASWELELNPAGVDRLEEEPKIFSLTPGNFGGSLSWYASPKDDKEHTDGKLAEDAAWVLERCAKRKDRPFFLALGFFRPHTPYVAPQKYFDQFPEKDMPVVQNVKEDQADIPPAGLASYVKPQDKLTDDLRRQCRQAYNASITFMDVQVGQVINALDRLGLADNTIIVFTSDHGYHMGEHGLWQKQSLFEESARVPLLIVAPGISAKGSVAKSPVGQIDLFPTLAELCNVKRPENLQGQSLAAMLKDPSVVGRGWAITQVMRGGGGGGAGKAGAKAVKGTGGAASSGDLKGTAGAVAGVNPTSNRFFGYSLRTPRWRYTEWDEGNRGRELYDHDNDPREITNLANESAHAKTVDELSQQLRAAAKSTLPPSGKSPEVQPGLWAPRLIGG